MLNDNYYFKSPGSTRKFYNNSSKRSLRSRKEETLKMTLKPKNEEDKFEMDRFSLGTDRTNRRCNHFSSVQAEKSEMSPDLKVKMKILKSKIEKKLIEEDKGDRSKKRKKKNSLGYFKKKKKFEKIENFERKKIFKIAKKETPKKIDFENFGKRLSSSTKKNIVQDLENLITKESSSSTILSTQKGKTINNSKFLYKPEKSLLKDISDLKMLSQYLKNTSRNEPEIIENPGKIEEKDVSAIIKKYEVTPRRDDEIEALDQEYERLLGLKDETLDSTVRVIDRKIAQMEEELFETYGIKFLHEGLELKEN